MHPVLVPRLPPPPVLETLDTFLTYYLKQWISLVQDQVYVATSGGTYVLVCKC